VTADGAYDGEPVYQAIASHQSDPVPDVVIPLRASAVPGTEDAEAQSHGAHLAIPAKRNETGVDCPPALALRLCSRRGCTGPGGLGRFPRRKVITATISRDAQTEGLKGFFGT
jgi:hypothetical protein